MADRKDAPGKQRMSETLGTRGPGQTFKRTGSRQEVKKALELAGRHKAGYASRTISIPGPRKKDWEGSRADDAALITPC
jgi:hypothetical protein